MMYIDSKTFEVIGDISDARISGPLFECDELLAPTISILNKLGFRTEFCCSGHAYDYKENKNCTVPYWINNSCYICFSKELEEMEKDGFITPEGYEVMKSDDYFDVVEDGEAPWKVQIFKEFNTNESPFLQVLDNAKALYTWACAMVYAKEKEREATKKKMEEIQVQIEMPSKRIVFAKDDPIFTKITFYDDVLSKEVTATVKDYLDFVISERNTFKDCIGEELSKRYTKLKSTYEYIRQRYLIPLLKPTQYCELAEIIYASLEELYGDLYDQYNDPTGSPIIGDKYYLYLDELVDTVDKYIVENYKVK